MRQWAPGHRHAKGPPPHSNIKHPDWKDILCFFVVIFSVFVVFLHIFETVVSLCSCFESLCGCFVSLCGCFVSFCSHYESLCNLLVCLCACFDSLFGYFGRLWPIVLVSNLYGPLFLDEPTYIMYSIWNAIMRKAEAQHVVTTETKLCTVHCPLVQVTFALCSMAILPAAGPSILFLSILGQWQPSFCSRSTQVAGWPSPWWLGSRFHSMVFVQMCLWWENL